MDNKPRGFTRKNGRYCHETDLILNLRKIETIIVEFNVCYQYLDDKTLTTVNNDLLKIFLDRKIGVNNYSYEIDYFKRDSGLFPFIARIWIMEEDMYNIVLLKNKRLKKLSKLRSKWQL